MSMKQLLIAFAMFCSAFALMTSDAQAAVALLHCKSATRGLELVVPYATGGVNPLVGTIRLMRGTKTYVEATNEDVTEYTNSSDRVAFTISDVAGKTVLAADFSFDQNRGRYVGGIKYAGAKIGMVCTTEL